MYLPEVVLFIPVIQPQHELQRDLQITSLHFIKWKFSKQGLQTNGCSFMPLIKMLRNDYVKGSNEQALGCTIRSLRSGRLCLWVTRLSQRQVVLEGTGEEEQPVWCSSPPSDRVSGKFRISSEIGKVFTFNLATKIKREIIQISHQSVQKEETILNFSLEI